MRYLLTILFLCSKAFATTYYVANAGSNSNNGTSAGTPFLTITKAFSVVIAGDNILLNKGDTWNERLVPITSGTAGNVITIGAYGTGNKPIVTGLQDLTGFTNVGNIWTATASNSVAKLNTVLIGGAIRAKARIPNTGYYTFTSYKSRSAITGSLSGTPNYTGAEAVIRTVPWVLDVTKIASQSGGTLNLTDSMSYIPQYGGKGYFIQNVNSALDTLNEWTFDSTSKVLKVYATSSPTVHISTIDTLVWLSHKSYITFDGVSFTGANMRGFQFDTCNNIVVQNCSVNNSGAFAFYGTQTPHLSILNDSIQNTLSNAIYLRQFNFLDTSSVIVCDTALVSGNYIYNTGVFAGMGLSNNGRYFGIATRGTGNIISNNTVINTGYIPINFFGANTLIRNNFIDSFAFVKDDAGGIYTSFPNFSGSKIISNIIQNGIGAPIGSAYGSEANGIYLDDNSSGVTVDSNSVSNCALSGIFIHLSNNHLVRWNNLYENGTQIMIGGPTSLTYGNNIKYNRLFADVGQFITNRDVYDTGESIDSNAISRWPTEGNYMVNQTSPISLTIWRNGTGWDRNSTPTPVDVTYDPVLYYTNPTTSSVTINIGLTYKDFYGNSANSFIIEPFGSRILFRALNQIIPPTPPGKTSTSNLKISIKSK